MFLSQTEAVANHNPGFIGEMTLLQALLSQMAQLNLFFQMPEYRTVVLHALQPIRLEFNTFMEIFFSFVVPDGV